MTGMLASVNSIEEARLVMTGNVDIIDLKNPAKGSLGALDVAQVKSIVDEINGTCLTSATIGDLPMQPIPVFNAVEAMASTGVNYIKIGFFPNGDSRQVIEKLKLISDKTDLIAVLFADTDPDYKVIKELKSAGFQGAMLDTLEKTNGSLTELMTKADIERFVGIVKSNGLICGLAGSLGLKDIPLLMSCHPDYLGFRGALCDLQDRVGRLDNSSVLKIRQTISDIST
jgi:uncharacterized protein (UPF0264 family)